MILDLERFLLINGNSCMFRLALKLFRMAHLWLLLCHICHLIRLDLWHTVHLRILMHRIGLLFSSSILLKRFLQALCSINWVCILFQCAPTILMAQAAASLVHRVVVIMMFRVAAILVHRVVVLRMFLAAATKVLPLHHRSSLLILGSCYLAMVGLVANLGADINLPLGCPSYRRCLVHPAVYLLNPQVKICQYYLI
jgi:hypothetical protein